MTGPSPTSTQTAIATATTAAATAVVAPQAAPQPIAWPPNRPSFTCERKIYVSNNLSQSLSLSSPNTVLQHLRTRAGQVIPNVNLRRHSPPFSPKHLACAAALQQLKRRSQVIRNLGQNDYPAEFPSSPLH